jgi:dihydrofolate reductase
MSGLSSTVGRMSRVIYNTATTLNGYLADENDSLSWLFVVPRGDGESEFSDFMATVGALVMGSATYEWLLEHEKLLDNPDKWF